MQECHFSSFVSLVWEDIFCTFQTQVNDIREKRGWILDISTVVENHKKVAFWCFQKITKIDHFWQFWWTFLHSNCKRSSLRSQFWMRLFMWFSTTVRDIEFLPQVWFVYHIQKRTISDPKRSKPDWPLFFRFCKAQTPLLASLVVLELRCK